MVSLKNLHLSVSIILIIPIALVYGLNPRLVLPVLFDFNIGSTGLANIFRSLMGLYIGISITWIVGVLKPKYWVTATIINIVFFGGLASGRLISFVLDGNPGIYILAGFLAETALAFWGWRNLKKYANQEGDR